MSPTSRPFSTTSIAHAAGADPVTKLVVLGDLFDFWTYPPEQQPPTIDEIIAANDAILGRGGKLAEAIAAVQGNVIYLRGNHDIGITQADLDRLDARRPPSSRSSTTWSSTTAASCSRTATSSRCSMPPTSAIPARFPSATSLPERSPTTLENTLAVGQTAADLQDQGSPYGFSLASFVPALSADLASPSVDQHAPRLHRCAVRLVGDDADPDGRRLQHHDQRRRRRSTTASGTTGWRATAAAEIGETFAAKAAKADYDGSYMAWFAQKAAFDHSARGAVTGHTHVPKQGIENSTCLLPQLRLRMPVGRRTSTAGRALFNFGVIETDGTPTLWCVLKAHRAYCVSPSRGRRPTRSCTRRSWTSPAT